MILRGSGLERLLLLGKVHGVAGPSGEGNAEAASGGDMSGGGQGDGLGLAGRAAREAQARRAADEAARTASVDTTFSGTEGLTRNQNTGGAGTEGVTDNSTAGGIMGAFASLIAGVDPRLGYTLGGKLLGPSTPTNDSIGTGPVTGLNRSIGTDFGVLMGPIYNPDGSIAVEAPVGQGGSGGVRAGAGPGGTTAAPLPTVGGVAGDRVLFPEELEILRNQMRQSQNITGLQGAVNQEFLQGGGVRDIPFFPGQITEGFDPAQTEAQNQQLAIARALGAQLPGQIQGAIDFGLEGVLDPASNPAAQRFQQAALDPVIENFTERVLPNLGSAAQQAGAFGGSRQGQLEAGLSRDLIRQMGDITANIQNTQFGQGLDAFGRTQALLPSLIGSQFAPAQALGDVGAERRGLAQAETAEDVARFEFGRDIGGERLAQASNLLGGSSGVGGLGGGTATQAVQDGPSGFSSALGGASSALGLFGTLINATGGSGGALGQLAQDNPWVGGGAAAIGALAGLFS